ncbi:hypothetical protein BX600DRAFT_450562 [Xylariales sp. PMI_506]|nr:hypothetical protein BX600DRAFT_450562 [Xylariales sp. PMI_506]
MSSPKRFCSRLGLDLPSHIWACIAMAMLARVLLMSQCHDVPYDSGVTFTPTPTAGGRTVLQTGALLFALCSGFTLVVFHSEVLRYRQGKGGGGGSIGSEGRTTTITRRRRRRIVEPEPVLVGLASVTVYLAWAWVSREAPLLDEGSWFLHADRAFCTFWAGYWVEWFLGVKRATFPS